MTRRRSTEAAIMLASRIVLLALTFFAGVATARLLRPEERGEYALFATVTAFVPVLVNLGLAEAIIYLFNRGFADARRAATSVGLGAVTAVVATAVASPWLLPWLTRHYFPSGGSALAALALASGVGVAVHQTASSWYQAQRRYVALSLLTLVRPLLFVVGLTWVWWTGAGLLAIAILFCVSALLGCLFPLGPLLPAIRPGVLDRPYLAGLFRFSLKSYANVVVNQLNYRMDVLLVGYLLADLAQVASYHIAASLAALLWVVPDAYGEIIYPRLAAQTDERARTREAVQDIRFVLVPVVAIAIALAVLAPVLIPLLFGPQYADSPRLLRLLLPGIVAMSVSKVVTRYFASRNRHELNSYWILTAVVVNAGSNLLLIPRLEAEGAAISASLAWSTLAVGLLVSFRVAGRFELGDWAGFPRRDLVVFRDTAARWIADARRLR